MDIPVQSPWFRRGYPGNDARLFGQFFGEGMYDFPTPAVSPYYRPAFYRHLLDSGYSGVSEVRSDQDRFTVYLDVRHFSPEEVQVSVADGYVEVRGKHEERQDDHGYVSREFQRRYRLPSDVAPPTLTCTLSGDGLLTLHAHKLGRDGEPCRNRERSIPVTHGDKADAVESS
ncbi:unnamed protein product [Arctogadus glacialis]